MDEVQTLSEAELQQAREVVEHLFTLLGVSGQSDVVDKDGILDVSLDTDDTGMVIGYHGEVLEALQLVLSLMVSKRVDRYVRVSLEVGDYKKNRTEYLEQLAQQVKERAIEEHREQVLSSLKSWERRVVHMALQNDDEVTSESMGEGKERVLIVRPK